MIEAGRKAIVKKNTGEDPRLWGKVVIVEVYSKDRSHVWVTLDEPNDKNKMSMSVKITSLVDIDRAQFAPSKSKGVNPTVYGASRKTKRI